MSSSNIYDVCQCVQTLRKIFSAKVISIPIMDVINSGILEKFPELLLKDDQPQLQEEIAWILTNIFSGTTDETIDVTNFGVIPPLIRLLMSTNNKVRIQSEWALLNVAIEDDIQLVNLLQNSGLEDQLVQLLNIQNSTSDQEKNVAIEMKASQQELANQAQLLFKMIQKMKLKIETLIIAANIFIFYIKNTSQILHVEVLGDTLQGLNYVIKQDIVLKDLNFDQALFKISKFINCQNFRVQKFSLRIMGQLAAGNEKRTQEVVDSKVLKNIHAFLQKIQQKGFHKIFQPSLSKKEDDYENHKEKEELLRIACFVISNISAGTQSQIKACFKSGCIKMIVTLLVESDIDDEEIHYNKEEEFEYLVDKNGKEDENIIKSCQHWIKDAIFVISNCMIGSFANTVMIVKFGVIPKLVYWLESNENEILILVIQSIVQIFSATTAFARFEKHQKEIDEDKTMKIIKPPEGITAKICQEDLEEQDTSEEIEIHLFKKQNIFKEITSLSKKIKELILKPYKYHSIKK
ncbi:MAG: putative nuclear transport factor importin alpha [Streblomastix strix]|uniref:Putative nuclear transport factor importin alpha n=1 Tax=Streblomastix strix TaxID=222440 RepID=A0A5J4XA33_9EUKA|nr:MAG: putative nuclear transport factor importin alpha [Streblomastix strix]